MTETTAQRANNHSIKGSINQAFVKHQLGDDCQCYLCNESNAVVLFEQLTLLKEQHKHSVNQIISQQRSRNQPIKLPPINHACLHIHATVGQWFRAVLRTTRNNIIQSINQLTSPIVSHSLLPTAWHSQTLEQSRRLSSNRISDAFTQAWTKQNGPLIQSQFTSNQSDSNSNQLLNTPIPSFCTILSAHSGDETSEQDKPVFSHSSILTTDQSITQSINHSYDQTIKQPPLILPVLSARSGLSIYLTARAFRRPSLVLVSAITIPDILSVLSAYDLIPVPIDFGNSCSLEVDIDALQAYRATHPHQFCRKSSGSTNKSNYQTNEPQVVAVLFAHLWGKQSNIQPLIDWSASASIEVWEDMAECWRGFPSECNQTSIDQSSSRTSSFHYPNGHLGHPLSDLVLLSFGTIKHSTAFGGGILIVSSQHQTIYQSINEIHESRWPVFNDRTFLSKLSKIGLGMLLLNFTQSIKFGKQLAGFFDYDHKRAVVDLLRGFGKSEDVDSLIERLNQSPSLSLLQTLESRLISKSINQSSGESGMDNTIKCEIMTRLLNSSSNPQTVVPGLDCVSTHYWLYPILTPAYMDRSTFISRLDACGIDAYMGATQLAYVEAGEQPYQSQPTMTFNIGLDDQNTSDESIDPSEPVQQLYPSQISNRAPRQTHNQNCSVAYDLMERVIYLPVHRWTDIDSICRMAAIIEIVCSTNPVDRAFDKKLRSKL